MTDEKIRVIDENTIEIYIGNQWQIAHKGFKFVNINLNSVEILQSYRTMNIDDCIVDDTSGVQSKLINITSVHGTSNLKYTEELKVFTSEEQEVSIKTVFLELHDKYHKSHIWVFDSSFFIVAIIPENIMVDICKHMKSESNDYEMNMLIKIPCYKYLKEREVETVVVPNENADGVAIEKISFTNISDKNLVYYELELKKVNAKIEEYPSEKIRRCASVIVKQVDQYISKNIQSNMIHKIDFSELIIILENLYYGINSKYIYDEAENHENLFEIDISDYELKKAWSKKEQFINMCEINGIINRYVKLSWLHSPLLETYILKAYVYHCLMVQKRDFIRYDFVNAISAAAKTESQYYMRLFGLGLVSFALAYVLPGCLLFWLISSGSIIFSILLSIFMANKVIYRREQRKDKKIILEIFASLLDINTVISSSTWSPSVLLNKISKIENKINIPEIVPFISKIKNRNPDVFCI